MTPIIVDVMPPPEPERVAPLYFTIPEVAEIMKCSRATINREIAKGRIPVKAISPRRRRIPAAWLMDWQVADGR